MSSAARRAAQPSLAQIGVGEMGFADDSNPAYQTGAVNGRRSQTRLSLRFGISVDPHLNNATI